MKLSELSASIENLPGLGPKKAKLFSKLNVFTVADLLKNFPRDYEDRTHRVMLNESGKSRVHTICKVLAHSYFGYGTTKTLKIIITDGTLKASLVAFNRNYLEKTLPVGSIVAVTGKFEVKYGELQSSSFETEMMAQSGELADFVSCIVPGSRIFPIYPLTEGLTQKSYSKAVETALGKYLKTIDNDLDADLIAANNLLSKKECLLKIHFPESMKDVEEAVRTLVYEELYFFEYKMLLRTLEHRGELPSDSIESMPLNVKNRAEFSPSQKKLLESLPFTLTDDQMNAVMQMNADIDRSQMSYNDMLTGKSSKTFSMQRLLQGDVGSGKTLVSFFVALRTIDYGGQAALLAPTELLARQHAENASRLLEPLGVRVAFLTGNLNASGRNNLVNALRDGNVDLVIGTHALFSQNVSYKNLQLAVIDEQHRFGVTQRESIIAKGRKTFNSLSHSPDVLLMSATPIPQTLALTAFGDLDVSVIKTMPCGRKPTKTYLTRIGNEINVYNAVKKELEKGHQAYFVYPRIENDDDSGLKSAEEMQKTLSSFFRGYDIALVHGKLDDDAQHKALDDFKNGKVQILVATTVVEVGVDVGNATCIVIEHANRFGLAELHQLRGRVGRSSLQSFCFLTYDKNISETGIARLKALHESNDGFYIAEQDLKLRGPGEVNGIAQSGNLTLSIADFERDKTVLMKARLDALKKLRNITS